MQDSSIIPVPVHKKYTFAGQQQKGFGLESVHGCNARCVFCCLGHYDKQQVTNVFTGETWYKQKKLMDWNLLEAIFKRHQPSIVILTAQGEPFSDPRIPDILQLGIKHSGEHFNLSIFSNANLMTEKVLDKIIPNPHFKSINFSLNAFSDETRMNIMGIPYKQAEENILMFLEKRRAYGREVFFNASGPESDDKQDLRVGITFVAVAGTYKGKQVRNTHEINAFTDHWNKILRQYHCNWQVGVFPAGNWAGAVPREVICQDMRQICPNGCGQWDCTGPTIDVDGQIMLCCYNSRWSFGSVLDDEALGRWHNRREIFGVQGRVLHASPFCDECSFRFIPTGWLGDFIWA
jgi:hypothetical protein